MSPSCPHPSALFHTDSWDVDKEQDAAKVQAGDAGWPRPLLPTGTQHDTARLTFLRENVKAASKVKGPSLAGTRRHASVTRVPRPAVPRGWGLSLHPHPTAPHLQGWLGTRGGAGNAPQGPPTRAARLSSPRGVGIGVDPQARPLRFHPRS